MEMFAHWNLAGDHPWKVTADVNAGASVDFSNQAPITYVRGLQRFENDQITRRWLGEGSRFRAELEEGVQYNAHDGRVDPYYRAFGGVGRPFKVHLRGKDRTVEVETGLRASGARGDAFNIRPEIRARLHW
jgi:hypothetical protein